MSRFFGYIKQVLARGSRKQFLLSIFVVSLLIRLAMLVYSVNNAPEELWEHGEIAHNIYRGHGFSMHWPYTPIDSGRAAVQALPPTHEGAFLPPLNPYILVGFYFIFGETPTAHTAYGVLLTLLSSLIPIVIYYLTRSFAAESVARLAGVLAAFNLLAAYAVTTYSGSTLYQLIAPLIFFILLSVIKKERSILYITAGLATGVMTMVRSEFFLLGPVMLLLTALLMHNRSAIRLRFIAVAMFAHLVVVFPWVYRNYQVFDGFVPVLSHPWYEIWRGNNPRANGTTLDEAGKSIWVHPVHDREIVSALDTLPYDKRFEIAADSVFKVKIFEFWQQAPLYAFGLGMKKVALFFTSDFHQSRIVNAITAIFSFLVMATSIVGIISSYRNVNTARRAAILFGFFLLCYLGLTFATLMLPRYQIYVLNTLLPMSAVGLAVTARVFGKGGS